MAGRTFAVGDIHGGLSELQTLLARLPELDHGDTLVFLGDYVDRGPCSAEVVALLRALPGRAPAKVVTLRGNHEDAWLRVIDRRWPEFVLPPGNGCLAALRSFLGRPQGVEGNGALDEELRSLFLGSFFPADVVEWMRSLPFWYEDEHAIYVHAGLVRGPDGFLHPSEVEPQTALLWCRDEAFFRRSTGKLVVFGHTATDYLPAELSSFTPHDPSDLWAGPRAMGLDTQCGKGGYLTCIELPAGHVYDSR